MANSIDFSFDSFPVKPVDVLPESYSHKSGPVGPPAQTADGEEYLCGDAGPGFPGNNPGRDQDRSRADERIPAIGCSRYVSAGPTPASYGSTGDVNYDTEGAY